MGQELTEVEGRAHADLARKAKEKELGPREQFRVPPLVKMGARPKNMVDT